MWWLGVCEKEWDKWFKVNINGVILSAQISDESKRAPTIPGSSPVYIMWSMKRFTWNCVRIFRVVMCGLSLPTSIKLNFHFVIIYRHNAPHHIIHTLSTCCCYISNSKKDNFSYCLWIEPWLHLMNRHDVHFQKHRPPLTFHSFILKIYDLVTRPCILLVVFFHYFSFFLIYQLVGKVQTVWKWLKLFKSGQKYRRFVRFSCRKNWISTKNVRPKTVWKCKFYYRFYFSGVKRTHIQKYGSEWFVEGSTTTTTPKW